MGTKTALIQRNMVTAMTLAMNDFKRRHAGSLLGITWVFIQPIVTILVFWFVFAMGMRTQTVQGTPFLVWLVCGLVPWFFFSEALTGATNSLVEYNYLVKKVVFTISILPAVKITSALLVHLVFIILMFIVSLSFGLTPTLETIQIIYYSLAAVALAGALSTITSAVLPFFRDLGQIVAIALQFGMWMTPIMWDESRLPESLQWILFINPMSYLVEGYRDAMLRNIWFWEKPAQTIYFWSVVTICGIFGVLLFRKLKPHFADVL